MEWKTVLTVLGAMVATYSAIAYVRSIIWGPTRPHRVTWGGWTLVGLLGLLSSHEGGAGIGLIVTAVFVTIVAIVFLLSLSPKYGKPGGGKLDYVAGGGAAVTLLSELFVNYSPAVGATVAVAADLVFLWPTLREAWRRPELEAVRPWIIGAVAEALGVAALGNYSYGSAAYSVYILLGNLAIIWALQVSPHRKKHTKRARAS